MVRTAGVLSLILASAAGVAALRAPRRPPADPPAATAREGALQLSVRLDRRWLDSRGGASYLEIGVAADGMPERGPRTAVNAVLVIDRSGSMAGPAAASITAAEPVAGGDDTGQPSKLGFVKAATLRLLDLMHEELVLDAREVDYGHDRSLYERTLSMTPSERIEHGAAFANFVQRNLGAANAP